MRLMVAAGGTGGHVFPAISVAQTILAEWPDTEILFVGTPRGLETTLVPCAGFQLELIRVAGLKRIRGIRRVKNLFLLPGAFWKSWRLLRRFSPTVVFGIGGYASGPILLLAALSRFRTVILEPNAVPGFSNRILSRFVDRVFLAFSEAQSKLPEKKCIVSGNPIRKEILSVEPPRFESEKRTVLVFGGSRGAKRLNDAVVGSLAKLAEKRDRLLFIHQTGDDDFDDVSRAYKEAGIPAEVHRFVADMAGAYGRTDVVVARAGSSVLEIAATGRPSILVPFPYAADDHQRHNAHSLKKAGAALYLEDEECTADAISKLLGEILFDTARLKKMSEAALTLRRADASQIISREFVRLSDAQRRAA